jgi:hypothetical protein
MRVLVAVAVAISISGVTAGTAAAPDRAPTTFAAAPDRPPTTVAAAPDRAPTTFAAAGCPRSFGEVVQTMSGRISGCLRIEPTAAGPHTVTVAQVPDLPVKLPPALKRKLGALHKTPPPHEPAAILTLSPSSGAPGTVVTVTARLRARLPRRQLYPDICWDGCALGLDYGAVAIHRITAREFRSRFVVPAAPWVQGGPVRIVAPLSGSYEVGLQCLEVQRGCASAKPEGVAMFSLRAGRRPAWCPSQARCAALHVTPVTGMPGDVVKLTGYAPLVSITGADRPSVFGFGVRRGRPHGPAVSFHVGNGELNADFGQAALSIQAPPSFASLRDTTPIAQTADALPVIGANPADPSTVAWCDRGAVQLVTADGVQQTTIPTAATAPVLAGLGYQPPTGPPVPCSGVGLIDSTAGTLAGVVAAFPAAPSVGGPPFYDVPLVTYDGGRTWSAVPVPSGSSLDGFGGFRYKGGALQAVFASLSRGGTKAYPAFGPRVLSELSTGAGSWSQQPLGCPPAGPCTELAPYLPGNCAMNGVQQALLRSTDDGRRFTEPELPNPLQACADGGVYATSAHDELLLDTISPYPVLRSSDGGASWHDIGVPRAAAQQQFAGPGGLSLLSDGSLLRSGSGGWQLLRHGARRWCRLRTPEPALTRLPQLSAVTQIGSQLWWLSGTEAADPPRTLEHVALSSLNC